MYIRVRFRGFVLEGLYVFVLIDSIDFYSVFVGVVCFCVGRIYLFFVIRFGIFYIVFLYLVVVFMVVFIFGDRRR